MFNLLPENLKVKIKNEYKNRRLTVILIFIVSIQIIFFILLIPAWLSSFYKEREVRNQVAEFDRGEGADAAALTLTIKSLNSKLNVLSSVLEYPKLLPFIDLIIANKSSQVTINKFIYVEKDSKNAELSITGVSSTREALVLFVKKLQETKSFKTVDLPISNLAKDKNIDYSITLTITNE